MIEFYFAPPIKFTMSQIDEFESAFKSAAKPVFRLEPVSVQNAVIVLDRDAAAAAEFLDHMHSFLSVLATTEAKFKTTIIEGSDYDGVQQFLDVIHKHQPDLVCTYRNLHIPATEYPYSLGVYIDVATQATDIPVLLFPRPGLVNESVEFPSKPINVLAVTDHLAGDSRLVSYAARFTDYEGKLTLVHVEDEHTFDRYIETIGKIPDIDTDLARREIMHQLLNEPTDYIESCNQGIQAAGMAIQVDSVVTVGHDMSDYRKLLSERQIDLLVMNTKDEDQLAMHGLAYRLSVEFRNTPLLLI